MLAQIYGAVTAPLFYNDRISSSKNINKPIYLQINFLQAVLESHPNHKTDLMLFIDHLYTLEEGFVFAFVIQFVPM